MRRGKVFLCLVLCSLPLAAAPQESSLQRAIRLTGEGSYAAALEVADNSENDLHIAQARLYVFHQAGALDEALEAGLRGLANTPQDPWLLDRCTYIALSLGLGELAARRAVELQAVLSPGEWDKVSWMLDEAQALQALRGEEAASLSRAHLVAAMLGVLAVVALLVNARTTPGS